MVPPHIRRLPGRPGSLPDRIWMKAARKLRPLKRPISPWQLERVPEGVELRVEPIALPRLDELPPGLLEPAGRILEEAEQVLAHLMKFVSAKYHR